MKYQPWLLAIPVFLFACTRNPSHEKSVFYYNETTGIASLDPAFAKNQSIIWPVHQIYNTLVEIDSGLNIIPSLAKSIEISQNRLIYTFHLRTDVFFHDHPAFSSGKGRKMNAHDIVYSLHRIIDPAVASSGAWLFNQRLSLTNGLMAIDDSTFQLSLRTPFHPILGILSTQYCSIVPKEVVEKYGKDFRRNPCGTGPFQFHSWDEGESLILHKNPNYWERDAKHQKLPYLDAIKVSFYDNKATEFLQFRQGKLSFINDIDPSFKDEILSKNGQLKPSWKKVLQLNKHPYLNTEYFGILVDPNNSLVKISPTRKKEIRQALNYGINKEQLVMYMRNSIGIAANAGFVPEGLPSANTKWVKGYDFNPIKAKELLKKAGFPNGAGLPIIKLLTVPIYADIASFAARQLEEIGIKIQVEVIQKSLLLEQTAKSMALFFRGSWIADYPDAENYLAMFYSKNPAPPNYTRYANSKFDQLYESALAETNDSARFQLYRAMDQLVMDESAVIPLWYDMAIHLVQPGIQGFKPNALNLLELRTTQMH